MRVWRGLRRAASSFSAGSSGDGAAPGGKPRRRAWETSLSPLERVRRLLPPEEAAALGRCAAAPQAPPKQEPDAPQEPLEAAAERPRPFRAGELALAELRRKHNATVKLLCRLAAGSALSSSAGILPHHDIIGQLPGQFLPTSTGARLLLRRPSLDEYVLLMPRGPTIAYPKDISAILMMMDIHPGDTVLEIGSGSGAMSLFLSRAVGPKGRVISYEIRDDHHNLAKKNYRHWRAAWEIGHMEEWPDNVDFVLKDISTAAADMKSVTLDAVIGLLDRIQTFKLPFLCERIIEVTHRNWLVVPAKIKNCKSSQMVETQENIEEAPQKEYEEIHIQDQVVLKEDEFNESFSGDGETFSSVPYVARPSCWQEAHSAFLTKLRKFRPLHSDAAEMLAANLRVSSQ